MQLAQCVLLRQVLAQHLLDAARGIGIRGRLVWASCYRAATFWRGSRANGWTAMRLNYSEGPYRGKRKTDLAVYVVRVALVVILLAIAAAVVLLLP